jgi:general secretion pathway protein K
MKRRLQRQRGFALLTVLAAIFVLTALVVPFHFDSRVELRLASRHADLEQARIAAASGVTLARRLLEEDTDEADGSTDIWALPIELERDEIYWSIRIEDEDGKLGLGGLFELQRPERERREQELLRLVRGLGHVQRLVPALLDWIDEDDQVRPGGAETLTYLPLGYACKNRDLDAVAEVYHIRGALAGSGRAQPEWERLLSTRPAVEVNVNTAPPAVLRALSEKMSRQVVSRLLERRTQKALRRISDLHEVPGLNNETYNEIFDRLTVSSSRFRIASTAERHGAVATIVAEVERNGSSTRLVSWSVR